MQFLYGLIFTLIGFRKGIGKAGDISDAQKDTADEYHERLIEAAAESDLIVLQGMGRGIESNWTEQFTCDVWRVALLKDRTVAQWIGAALLPGVIEAENLNRLSVLGAVVIVSGTILAAIGKQRAS